MGSPNGYFPDLTKSILVISVHNLMQAERFFRGKGLTIVMGVQYHYIGGAAPQSQCLGDKVEYWAVIIRVMELVARKHLEAAYAYLKKSLQQEWSFVQRATQGLGWGGGGVARGEVKP